MDHIQKYLITITAGLLLAFVILAIPPVLTAHPQPPAPGFAPGSDLPVDTGALLSGTRVTSPLDPEMDYTTFVNELSVTDIQKSIHDGEAGLVFDISSVPELIDGRPLDPARLHGMLYIGPYPYQPQETGYRYKRYLSEAKVAGGKALIPVKNFLDTTHNTEGWTDNGTISVRVILAYNGTLIGGYDTIVGFTRDSSGFHKVPWLMDGPFVNRIDSRQPDQATISFDANEPAPAQLYLSDGRVFDSPAQVKHEILLTGLAPDTAYTYRIGMSGLSTPDFQFRSAPLPGRTRVVFAAAGDSRQGYGGFLNNFMGLNYATLDMISSRAYAADAEFFIIAGDLVDGYTMSDEDYKSQLNAFKQCMSGFWNSRPVFTGMGNHELIYDIGSVETLSNR
jgi:hypothetical protein